MLSKFCILFILIFFCQFVFANAFKNSDTCELIQVSLTAYKRHSIVESKLAIAQSIQQNFSHEKKLILFFANPLNYLDNAASLIVLDSNNIIVEGFKFPSCCDGKVFNSRSVLDRKIIRKLSKINFNNLNSSIGYFECSRPEVTGMFSELFIFSNGTIQTGLIIGATGVLISTIPSAKFLVQIFDIMNSR